MLVKNIFMDDYKRKYLVSATFMDGDALQAEIPAMTEKTAKQLFDALPDVLKRTDAGVQIVQYSVVEIDEDDESGRFIVNEEGETIAVFDTFLMQECRFQKGHFSETYTINKLPGGYCAAEGEDFQVFDRYIRETYPLFYGTV